MKMFGNRQESLDVTGVSLSVVCILHCLLVPTAASAAPLLSPELGSLFGLSHDWHIVLLALAAPVSLVALGWGMKTVRAGWRVFAVGLAGLVLMAIGASHAFGPTAETVLTLIGVSVLAGAHLANWRARARAGHVHKRDCGLCEHEPHA
ncbi:MAG: MerC domain-containing protein [Pseudomonadota bacterium]|nr:MerC domain-containing protein [Pseudomonadota bacterium]